MALGLRLVGIGWGLPNEHHQQSYHPDEPTVWMYSQNIQPTALDFTPGFYNYGTFYLTLLKVATDVTAAYGGGGIDPKNPDSAWEFIGRSHLTGRCLNVLAGAASALIVFLILRRFSSDLGAAFGGLFIALAPAHIVHSRFQTVDVMAAFLIAASTYFALRIVPQERVAEKLSPMKLSMLSGSFAGLSAGTKYTGILCLLTLLVVLFAVGGPSKWKLSAIGVASALIAFLVVTPGVVLEPKVFWEGFMYETRHVKEGHGLVFEGTSPGFIYHLANIFFGAGLLMGMLGIAGLFGAVIKRHTWAWGLCAFFVAYYLVIAGAEVKFIRYTLPLYVGMAVGFGWMIGRSREKGGRWHAVVGLGILALGGFFGGGLMSSAKFSLWMAAPDPRDAAGDFLRAVDDTVGLVSDPWFYSPAIHPALGRRLVYEVGMPQVAMTAYGDYLDGITSAMQSPKVVRFAPTSAEGQRDLRARIDWDERLLSETKPEYVVFSSFETEGLSRVKLSADISSASATIAGRARVFMDRLRTDYLLTREFGAADPMVHDMMYVQPKIWVWKRKPDR